MKYFVLLVTLLMFASCSEHSPFKSWNEIVERKCEEQLKKTLNDPSSYQDPSWSHFKIPYKSYYLFTNSYRAKNKMGALILTETKFLVDSLNTNEVIIHYPELTGEPQLKWPDFLWEAWIKEEIRVHQILKKEDIK